MFKYICIIKTKRVQQHIKTELLCKFQFKITQLSHLNLRSILEKNTSFVDFKVHEFVLAFSAILKLDNNYSVHNKKYPGYHAEGFVFPLREQEKKYSGTQDK